jgi:hypothetical protein
MGEKKNKYRILVGKSEGTRPLGSFRNRWEDLRQDGVVLIGFIRLRIGTGGGLL